MVFSFIGGSVFLGGLILQAALTGGLHMAALASYLIQAVASVQASFALNRWLTWRDRNTPFWVACARFNAQKVVTISLNFALYAGLLRLGMNYLAANVALTAVFTVVNYVAGDRLVFTPAGLKDDRRAAPSARLEAPPVTLLAPDRAEPGVSVVIPCRNNERTIGATVRSLLDQDYPGLEEIILVGSPGDRSWDGLWGITDPRVVTRELHTPPGVRDANFKRDAGIKMSTSDLVALVDSDIVLPQDWMSRAVAELTTSGAACVAGGMKSIHDSFWGRFTDSTVIGAKTPRVTQSYTVTSADFGVRGKKPPITSNTLFTRELYDRCSIDPSWSHGSYEDYEWFWRVVDAGYDVRVSQRLFGWHHHRRGLRTLAREYRRSSRGCAYFIRAHRDSPFARRRLRQAIVLPMLGVAGITTAATAVAGGYTGVLGLLLLCAALLLTAQQVARSQKLEAVAYPFVGLALGVVFTTGLVAHLIRSGAKPEISARGQPASVSHPPPRAGRPWWRLPMHPLTAVLAVQVGLSASLVSANTAFTDEADNLWLGHLVISSWLHGTSWPSAYGERILTGSPVIYPPLGALADSVAGLSGARILSLVFMLGATVLLYLTASRLFGATEAFVASLLWAISEPVIGLAFASHEPLSLFLTALSAWLAVQAGIRRHHGELVAASAAALALANATAYLGVIIDPVVVGFTFLVWMPRLGTRQAAYSAGWFTGAWALFTGMALTFSRSWLGFVSTLSGRASAGSGALTVLGGDFKYSGLVIVLAAIGTVIAMNAKSRRHALVPAFLGGAALLVPAVQFFDRTSWSHLDYGIWFGVMTAGYACTTLLRRIPRVRTQAAIVICAVLLVYPAVLSWQSASSRAHRWANAQSFISAFSSVTARTNGLIFASGVERVAQYYTPQGNDWGRWASVGLTLDPAIENSALGAYYSTTLHTGNYGVLALFYAGRLSAVASPGTPLDSQASDIYRKLTSLASARPKEPGVPALTLALEKDPRYRLVAVGPYDSSTNHGIYAIWQKVAVK